MPKALLAAFDSRIGYRIPTICWVTSLAIAYPSLSRKVHLGEATFNGGHRATPVYLDAYVLDSVICLTMRLPPRAMHLVSTQPNQRLRLLGLGGSWWPAERVAIHQEVPVIRVAESQARALRLNPELPRCPDHQLEEI